MLIKRICVTRITSPLAAFLLLASTGLTPVRAAAPEGYVSRKEYETLKKEMEAMKARLDAVETQRASNSKGADSATVASLRQEIADVRAMADEAKPGTTKFHIAGSAAAGFTSLDNDNSNFSAKFSPILLWELSDNLFFESEVEMELEDTDTSVKLEYANMAYNVNDYITLTAGKFLNPMNNFVERYEPAWINRLPDTPLSIYDGILPESNVGAQVRAVIPVGPTKFNLAAYVSNAPRIEVNDPEAQGQLIFDNFSSLSDNKAVGGRIGFQPFPWMEVGYGIQHSKVTAEDFGSDPNANLQSVDLSVRRDSKLLKGTFTLLGQYAWSQVSTTTYPTIYADDGSVIGDPRFHNKRDGGYVQLSYRPKGVNDTLDKFEFIVRGDRAETPDDAPGAFNEERLTLGLDYWINASTVIKAAYEFDSRTNGEPDHNGVLVQAAMGF